MFFSCFECIQDWLALSDVIWHLIQNTIFKSKSKQTQNFIIDLPIALELRFGFGVTDYVVGVALIDSWNTVVPSMIPWIFLLIRLDNCFCWQKFRFEVRRLHKMWLFSSFEQSESSKIFMQKGHTNCTKKHFVLFIFKLEPTKRKFNYLWTIPRDVLVCWQQSWQTLWMRLRLYFLHQRPWFNWS